MSVPMTAGSAAASLSSTVDWRDSNDPRQPAANMFTVLARGNELILVPLNDVARLLLSQWMSAKVQMTATYHPRGPQESFIKYGAGMKEVVLQFEHGPLLSSGGDPHFTGMHLGPEEYELAREVVIQRRTERAPRQKRGKRKS